MPTKVAADVFKHYVKVSSDAHRQNVVEKIRTCFVTSTFSLWVFSAMWLRIQVFWDVILCEMGSQHFDGPWCIIQRDLDCITPEDDGITVFSRITNHLSNDAASYPRRH
jgi:hypothetical protein